MIISRVSFILYLFAAVENNNNNNIAEASALSV